jgi:hypothetical protein
MINGDDSAARAKTTYYGLWKNIAGAVGLIESIGKTFRSREFVNINSTNYLRCEPREFKYMKDDGTVVLRQMPFKEVPFINLGIVYGNKRSGVMNLNDQSHPATTLASHARTLERQTPPDLWEAVYETFLLRNKEMMTMTRLPWFIPEWLGGLGLPIMGRHKPSELDLRMAQQILFNWKKKKPISIAHPTNNWMTRRIAQAGLPEPLETDIQGKETEWFEKVTGLKCLDLLFDSTVSIDDLYHQDIKGERQDPTNKAIKQNAKLWTPPKHALPQPLSTEALLYRQSHSAYLLPSKQALTTLTGSNKQTEE